jgi:hypothetical protein
MEFHHFGSNSTDQFCCLFSFARGPPYIEHIADGSTEQYTPLQI